MNQAKQLHSSRKGVGTGLEAEDQMQRFKKTISRAGVNRKVVGNVEVSCPYTDEPS